MKLTDTNFQTMVKAGTLLLAISTVGSVYILLRHREVYRDASRVEVAVQQKTAALNMQQQLMDAVVRDFAAHASTDPGVMDIFQRLKNSQTPTTATEGPKP
jgi:hypothetical protein